MRRSRRLISIAVVALLVAAAAAYSGWWWICRQTLETGIDGWIAARRAEGMRIEISAPSFGGFPHSARATIASVALSWLPGALPSGRLNAEDVAITFEPWAPSELTFQVAGPFDLELDGGPAGPTQVRGDGAEAELSILSRGRGQGTVYGLEAQGPDIGALAAERAEFSLPGPTAESHGLPFRATLSEVSPPPAAVVAVGDHISSLEVKGTLEGRLDLAGQPLELALDDWRAADGRVRIEQLTLAASQLDLNGEGWLSLDPDLQPRGEAMADARGLPQMIQRLGEAGQIAGQDARIAATALTLLARKDDPSRVALPLKLSGGTVSSGPLALFRIPPLAWPDRPPEDPGTALPAPSPGRSRPASPQ